MVKQPCSNVRVITANSSDVRIFRIFTILRKKFVVESDNALLLCLRYRHDITETAN